MKPVISLVGRPNVGKSTLFNQLTRTRDALVADFPGLTRDRKYGIGKVGGSDYLVVDTGGLGEEGTSVGEGMAEQTRVALKESHVILLLVDAREGLTATDQLIADELRSYEKPVVLAVNKTDGIDADQACAEFHELGLGHPFPIASVHGRGIGALMTYALSQVPSVDGKEEKSAAQDQNTIRIAVVGRPNVGKSTLINRLLGEQRLLTFDEPGTTRDSIEISFQRNGQRYILIDTAGVRRRSRVKAAVEKFSIVKSLQAIDSSQVVILVLDARQGIADQDARLLGLVLESGRGVVLAINKWDGLSEDERAGIRREFDLHLSFMSYAERHMISALHGTGVSKLLQAVNRAYHSAMIQVGTAELTRLLEQAVGTYPPPLVRGRRIKLRYAHQGGHNPPLFILYGNQTQHIKDAYRRYLTNFFTKALRLQGTPLRLAFKTGGNPYAGRRNKLTPRQRRKRKRLLRHARRG